MKIYKDFEIVPELVSGLALQYPGGPGLGVVTTGSGSVSCK